MMDHVQSDVISYVAFLLGQLLFLLKRAGSAMRNPSTKILTRWDYFKNNWDTFGIRALMESPFFYGWKHYGFASFVGLFGWHMPVWMTVPDSPFTAFFLGYAADSLLDWVSMSPKLPEFFQRWVKENVPTMDSSIKLKMKLDKAAEATQEAAVATDKAVIAVEEAKAISPSPHVGPPAPPPPKGIYGGKQ